MRGNNVTSSPDFGLLWQHNRTAACVTRKPFECKQRARAIGLLFAYLHIFDLINFTISVYVLFLLHQINQLAHSILLCSNQ